MKRAIILSIYILYNFPVIGLQLINLKQIQNKETNLSALALSSEFIKLETNDNCLIGRVGSIKQLDSNYLVFDKISANFLIFNNKGGFVKKISIKGKGPGECLECNIINVDPLKKEIQIFDTPLRKMIFFDYNFNYLREFTLPFFSDRVAQKDGLLFFYIPGDLTVRTKGYSVIVTDQSGKGKKRLQQRPPVDSGLRFYKISSCNDLIYYWESYYDTIYRINGLKPIAFKFLDYPDKIPANIMYNDQLWTQGNLDYFAIWNIFFSQNYWFFHYIHRHKVKYCYYDLSSEMCTNIPFWDTMDKFGFRDDISSLPPFVPELQIDSDTFARAYEIIDLKSILKDRYFNQDCQLPKNHKEFMRVVGNSSVEDNPILHIVRMK